jgi:glycine/D-amino acid oxidase-like deaminating enzyme
MADVGVIGAGAVGCSAVLHLEQTDPLANVVVVEPDYASSAPFKPRSSTIPNGRSTWRGPAGSRMNGGSDLVHDQSPAGLIRHSKVMAKAFKEDYEERSVCRYFPLKACLRVR